MVSLLDNEGDRRQPRPDWIDDKLIAETKAVWEPIYGRCLTNSEVLEIVLNVARLIDAL